MIPIRAELDWVFGYITCLGSCHKTKTAAPAVFGVDSNDSQIAILHDLGSAADFSSPMCAIDVPLLGYEMSPCNCVHTRPENRLIDLYAWLVVAGSCCVWDDGSVTRVFSREP